MVYFLSVMGTTLLPDLLLDLPRGSYTNIGIIILISNWLFFLPQYMFAFAQMHVPFCFSINLLLWVGTASLFAMTARKLKPLASIPYGIVIALLVIRVMLMTMVALGHPFQLDGL